jgi:2-polyprenyl-3-methyl-5-hydroxy-6-metoxy-1,4-benzoquinol methylase
VRISSRCICGSDQLDTVFSYDRPPEGEIRFEFSSGAYQRKVVRCRHCGHFLSVHDMDMTRLYAGQYVDATYADGLKRAYDRVIALASTKSDNAGRVAHVAAYARARLPGASIGRVSVLDVGSGLCVFLSRLKQETGWHCVALDPDFRAASHAREVAGIEAVCGDFMEIDDLGRFDIVTFNKVLEHVEDPVAMLTRANRHLAPGGFVYVELPDGEAARLEGPEREEFFIDHHHIFSLQSLSMLSESAGFRLTQSERLREPSTKFTLRGFLEPVGKVSTTPDG